MISIREVTELTGLSAPTLRYYESEGLIPYVKRDENGRRLYDHEALECIRYVTLLKTTGMPISQIRKYVCLYKEGNSTITVRKSMLTNHKEEIENRMKELYSNLDKINYKLALYDILESQMNNTTIKI